MAGMSLQAMGDDIICLRGSVHVQQFRGGRQIDARSFDNLVVTVGKAWLAGALSGDVASPETMKYIELGTGTTAAAAGDTTLVAAVETRASGTQSRVTTTTTSDTYQAVGTVSITDTRAITECGIFSASSSGTLMARQTFAAINCISGDSVQITWKIQLT